MAYETLLPPDYGAARNYGTVGDIYYPQDNGLLVRPYIGEDIFYEEDLGIEPEPEYEEPYDPLTAPFEKVVETEYDSVEAYVTQPTLWDRQANAAFQEQRAHGEALVRTIALQSMKRVSEYRANFPTDADTLQLRLVEPEPSSVDIMLAESRQLRDEIAYELAHPPMFGYAQSLHTKQYETVPPSGPTSETVLPPTDSDSAKLPLASASLEQVGSRTVAGDAEGGAQLSQASAEHIGKATDAAGPVSGGSTRTRFEKLKALSVHGARKFISRITRQAVLWG